MITTRDRLIKYIDARQSATAKEISLALNLSAADIRHHLTYLVQEGVLEIIGTKNNKVRGRPSRIYVIASPLYKDNLDILTDALLEQLFANYVTSTDDQTVIIQKLASYFLINTTQSYPNKMRQINSAIHWLNKQNYQARWEAHQNEPRIMFSHCPYKRIIHHHPEICRLDVEILKQLLDSQVQLIAKLLKTPQGLSQCIFKVKLE